MAELAGFYHTWMETPMSGFLMMKLKMSHTMRKPVSEQVQHKSGCTPTEDGQRLEISDLGSRGIVLSM